jgi:hypothetical protein
MNVTEYLVKLADRLDSKGREDLANKVDRAIAQLKQAHCGSCEQDAQDPTTDELIQRLEQNPFQPSVSADEDPTDEEVADLWK